MKAIGVGYVIGGTREHQRGDIDLTTFAWSLKTTQGACDLGEGGGGGSEYSGQKRPESVDPKRAPSVLRNTFRQTSRYRMIFRSLGCFGSAGAGVLVDGSDRAVAADGGCRTRGDLECRQA